MTFGKGMEDQRQDHKMYCYNCTRDIETKDMQVHLRLGHEVNQTVNEDYFETLEDEARKKGEL